MTRPPSVLPAAARPDADLDEFLTWCAETPNVMAFKDALRRVPPERWGIVRAGLVDALMLAEPPSPGSQAGYAADRDRRSRSAARVLKLDMLGQQDGARSVRYAEEARAQRKLAQSELASLAEPGYFLKAGISPGS